MAIEEGGEARTIYLCQQCYNAKVGAAGQTAFEVVVKEAHRGRLWKVMGNEQFLCGMCEYFTVERAGARTILADAAREKHEGMQGQ